MKIIHDTDLAADNITSVLASSEDAAFPDDNVLNNWTNDVWKANSGTSAMLTFEVSKGSAIMIFNTNAVSVTLWAGSGESFDWESGFSWEAGFSWTDDEVATSVTYDLPGVRGRLWAEYPEFTVPHVVKVTLTTASGVPYAGIARAGVVQEFADPRYGIEEESQDFSIEKELNNGASYFRKRSVVRSYPKLELIETRANAFLLKHDVFDSVGPEPLAIKLVSNAGVTDDEFILFAKRVEAPQISHITLTHSKIELSLTEVV